MGYPVSSGDVQPAFVKNEDFNGNSQNKIQKVLQNLALAVLNKRSGLFDPASSPLSNSLKGKNIKN